MLLQFTLLSITDKKFLMFCTQHCSKDILITKEAGSVLHRLIRGKFTDAIKNLYDKFKNDRDFLVELTNKRDKMGQSPIEAVVRMASEVNNETVEAFQLFLEYEAEVDDALEAAIDVSDLRLLKCLVERDQDKTLVNKFALICLITTYQWPIL